MNLISCAKCGCVLDMDRISRPEIKDPDSGLLIEGTYGWHYNDAVPLFACPVCKTLIFYHSGETIR